MISVVLLQNCTTDLESYCMRHQICPDIDTFLAELRKMCGALLLAETNWYWTS